MQGKGQVGSLFFLTPRRVVNLEINSPGNGETARGGTARRRGVAGEQEGDVEEREKGAEDTTRSIYVPTPN